MWTLLPELWWTKYFLKRFLMVLEKAAEEIMLIRQVHGEKKGRNQAAEEYPESSGTSEIEFFRKKVNS